MASLHFRKIGLPAAWTAGWRDIKIRRDHSHSPEKKGINDGGLELKWWEMTKTELRTLLEMELGTSDTFLTTNTQLWIWLTVFQTRLVSQYPPSTDVFSLKGKQVPGIPPDPADTSRKIFYKNALFNE